MAETKSPSAAPLITLQRYSFRGDSLPPIRAGGRSYKFVWDPVAGAYVYRPVDRQDADMVLQSLKLFNHLIPGIYWDGCQPKADPARAKGVTSGPAFVEPKKVARPVPAAPAPETPETPGEAPKAPAAKNLPAPKKVRSRATKAK